MQVASPIIHRHHSADNLPMTPPSSQEKSMDDTTSPIDVSQVSRVFFDHQKKIRKKGAIGNNT